MQINNYTEHSTSMEVNYSKLENLLKRQSWKEADQETFEIMLKVSGREKEGFLFLRDWEWINYFPVQVLHRIDQLWWHYSYGRFSFSVQRQIWESLGGEANANHETFLRFCGSVKWYDQEWSRWNNLSTLIFDIDYPRGCFPLLPYTHKDRDEGLTISQPILQSLLSHPNL